MFEEYTKDDEEKYIKLLSANDVEFIVHIGIASMSTTIKNMLEGINIMIL